MTSDDRSNELDQVGQYTSDDRWAILTVNDDLAQLKLLSQTTQINTRYVMEEAVRYGRKEIFNWIATKYSSDVFYHGSILFEIAIDRKVTNFIRICYLDA